MWGPVNKDQERVVDVSRPNHLPRPRWLKRDDDGELSVQRLASASLGNTRR